LKNKMENLISNPLAEWSLAYKIESNFRYIISEQEAYGWKIDLKLKEKLEQDLTKKKNLIQKIINRRVPFFIKRGKEVQTILKKDNTPSKYLIKWWDRLDKRSIPLSSYQGVFTEVIYQDLNLSSVPQKRQILKKLNWKPTEWNFKKTSGGDVIKGIPSNVYSQKWFDENSWQLPPHYLNSLDLYQPIITGAKIHYDESNRHIKPLISFVRYAKVVHRLSLLQGGLTENIREDGSVGSGGITCGTNTGRMRHRGIVNIPKADKSVFYGTQIRSIFTHRPGYTLVGADLASLENRLMGHYTYPIDQGAYAHRLESEDSHETTQVLVRSVGLDITRNQAKTMNYALGYGAQIKKIASILDCDISLARKAYAVWWSDKSALKTLQENIEKSLMGRGQYDGSRLKPNAWIKGLDGRKVFVRSPHSLVNCLIQNAGAVVSKFITCSIYKQIKERGLDAHPVCVYHDEINIECERKDLTIQTVNDIIVEAVKRCNEFFKFRIPMEMDIKTGGTWAEIH